MRKLVRVVLLAAVAAGCAVGPNYSPPEIAVPELWHAPAEGGEHGGPVDLAKWWEVFGDAQLNALIAEATQSNFDLRVAEARVREARAARGIVRADLYPNVGVSGAYQHRQLQKPDPADPSVSVGHSVNQYTSSRSATLRTGDISASSTSSITRLGTLLMGNANNVQQGNVGGQGGQQGGGSLLHPFQNRSLSISPDSTPSFDRTQDLYQAGFDASWELDVFGGNKRAVEAADADIAAAEEGRRDVLVSLLAEVARNYLTLREAQTRLGIANDNITAQRDTLNITVSRFDAGLTSELDVTRAQAQLATTSSQVPAVENIIASTIHRLGVLLGKDPAALYDELTIGTPLPPTPPELPTGMPSDLLRRRADVRRAERELAAATARIGEATADLFPKFSLTGNFGFQSNKPRDFTIGANQIWGFGPAISWPVFDAGRIRANIGVQNARQEQAFALYEKAVKESLEDAETSLVAYAKEQERYQMLGTATNAEKRAVELANERYARGLSDFVDVLDTQRSLYLAQDQLVQSQTTILLNLVTLYKALGGGWESFETVSMTTPPDQPLNKDNSVRTRSQYTTIAASFMMFLLAGMSATAQPPGSGPPPPPDVTVITVQPTLVPVTFDYSGVTAASKTVEIRARVRGYIETRDFEEGTLVKKGTRLFTIDPRTFEADREIAAARVEQAEASRKLADQEVTRLKSVSLPGAVAATDVDKQVAALAEATAALRLAKAELAKSELELSYTKIDAPMDGLIGKSMKEIGSLVDVGENSLLAVMHQVSPIYVSVRVSERDYLAWRTDQESGALVLTDGQDPYLEITLNDLTTYEKRGTVNFLSPELNTQTGSYEMRAEFENPDVKLRPGQFIKGHLKGWGRPNSIAVPQRAVTQSPLGPFVFVVGDDKIAQQRPVALGQWTGTDWIITTGLSAGDRVIVEGLTKVRPGSEVNPTDPSENATDPKAN